MSTSSYQVLITGTNRGLGLEFTRQYAADGWNVLACCRDPESASELKKLAAQYDNIRIIKLDVNDFTQITSVATALWDEKIDVLINNAGIYPHSDFGDTNADDWAAAFKINAIAPLKMAENFVHQLAESQLKKIVTLSSKMGSVDDNTSGGSYIYRSSKTAANMVMKSLSIDLKPLGIAAAVLHPGWVQTDMGGPNGLINTQQSVSGLRKVIDELNVQNAGRFIAYDGKVIPW